jgi:MFS family permease
VALSVAMTIGRLTGDRVVDRFGRRRVARAGGALAAVGMGLALALPSVPAVLAGFALAGLGVATLIPAVYQAADELPGLPHGVGLAVINWLLRIGFLVSPPLIGALADATSLRVALLSVVLAGVGAAVLGRALPGRPPAARPGG